MTISKIEIPNQKLKIHHLVWSKMKWMRDNAKTEVSGFGISSKEDPLYIIDFILVEQRSTLATTNMEDEAVANFAEDMLDLGYEPSEFGRIWIHTHPKMQPSPSMTDETTFYNCFGKCNWAVMLILGEADKCTSILQYNISPPCRINLPIEIIWETNKEEWEQELKEKVKRENYKDKTKNSFYTSLYKKDKPSYYSMLRSNYSNEYYGRQLEEELEDDLCIYSSNENEKELLLEEMERFIK